MNLNDLPGAEIILPGLSDLDCGKPNTIGALLIAIAATRLTEAGLDIQKYHLSPEPELTLYAFLHGVFSCQRAGGDLSGRNIHELRNGKAPVVCSITNSLCIMLEQITPLILTYNEAFNIDRTLKKLTWDIRIVVIDSYNDGATLDILKSYPQIEIFQRQFDTHDKQWNFGIAEELIKLSRLYTIATENEI